jgi:hypothetical protein
MAIIRYNSTQNIQSGDYALKTTSFNASSTKFILRLDPAGITRPGVYALIKSTGVTNAASPIADAFFDPPYYLNVRGLDRNSSVVHSDGTFDTILVRVE